LHFHNAGTHAGGRKAQRALRRELKGQGYSKAGIKGALAAFDAQRKAGAWHDPPRPMIPDDADGIPPVWERTIRDAAIEVMRGAGAEVR
jgi:hypothetical protein